MRVACTYVRDSVTVPGPACRVQTPQRGVCTHAGNWSQVILVNKARRCSSPEGGAAHAPSHVGALQISSIMATVTSGWELLAQSAVLESIAANLMYLFDLMFPCFGGGLVNTESHIVYRTICTWRAAA